jgi:hypothetical protein
MDENEIHRKMIFDLLEILKFALFFFLYIKS